MSHFLFWAILAVVSLLLGSLAASLAVPRISVWPLPREGEWGWRLRRSICYLNGSLIAVAAAGVLVLGLLDTGSLALAGGLRWPVGLTLFAVGSGFGLSGYLRLGPRASHGRERPLETAGPYRYSRNPQYVGAIGVMLGFSLASASRLALVTSLVTSGWFLLAPFAEERWLRERIGESYRAYLHSAPRFIGLPRRARRAG